ncbi:MAG TPA: acylphosphatase [Holophagaceae bacterium]|nr:acylphosphatase [Holophagaceae bacterium]
MLRARFRVTGRVQGVGFRWWAREEARALGLAGFVLNEPDGAVSGRAEGEIAAMEAFRTRLAGGPPQGSVAALQWEVDAEAGSGAQSLPFPFVIQR